MNKIIKIPLTTYGTWKDAPKEIVQEIVAFYADDKSVRAISRIYQCDHALISKILKNNGIEIRRKRKFISQKEREFIISEYQSGASSYDIKKILKRNTWVITKVLKDAGIEIRNHHKSGPESHNWKGGVSKDKKHCNARAVRWMNEKKENDPIFRLKIILRSRILSFFHRGTIAKEHGLKKSKRSKNLLGAEWDTIKEYIESKFLLGMTWENHGRYGWHFDHIKPLAMAKNEAELIELFHYTNLQPMWAKENHRKSSVYDGVRYGNLCKNGGKPCL